MVVGIIVHDRPVNHIPGNPGGKLSRFRMSRDGRLAFAGQSRRGRPYRLTLQGTCYSRASLEARQGI